MRATAALALLILGITGLVSACDARQEKAPPSPQTSTSVAPPSPTEKAVTPGGGNSFSPTVKAPPAPTAIPGDN
nr:hypothetical protein [Mycobacterium sp. M26]